MVRPHRLRPHAPARAGAACAQARTPQARHQPAPARSRGGPGGRDRAAPGRAVAGALQATRGSVGQLSPRRRTAHAPGLRGPGDRRVPRGERVALAGASAVARARGAGGRAGTRRGCRPRAARWRAAPARASAPGPTPSRCWCARERSSPTPSSPTSSSRICCCAPERAIAASASCSSWCRALAAATCAGCAAACSGCRRAPWRRGAGCASGA